MHKVIMRLSSALRSSSFWLSPAVALSFGACGPFAQAQSHSESMSALSAQEFHRDVQRRISASTHDGPTYYLRGYNAVTPEQKRALEESNKSLEMSRQNREKLDELRQDPMLMRYVNGHWEHYQAKKPAAPGEFCAATYTNLHGSITLNGVDKSWEGGLLTFIGKDIPKPGRFSEISATLTQSGGSPATVKIFNPQSTSAMGGYGTLIFAVPSMNAALAGMSDKQEFAISIEGKEVFRMSWKEGSSARDTLRHCMRRR